jgi:hypothetical protein
MTDKELKALVASLSIAQKETARQQKETGLQLKETDREFREFQREGRQQLKELGKQIGGLGNMFGNFTEGFMEDSLQQIMFETFHLENVIKNAYSKKKGMQFDFFAYANTKINEVIIVEIKTQLSEDAVDQIKNQCEAFHEAFPEHKGKKVYGGIAAVSDKKNLHARLWKEGLYYFNVTDDTMKLNVPKHFHPKNWQIKGNR